MMQMQVFEDDGVCIIRKPLSQAQFDEAFMAVELILGAATEQRGGPGVRAFGLPDSVAETFTGLAARLAGKPARLVRILAFDKTADMNWGVGWHQDRTIAVREKVDAPGFGPWSVKAGTPHVEPPAALLEQMFTLRLHLDDCGEDNGPLKVVLGSHKLGRLGAREVVELAGRSEVVSCVVAAGDVVAMKGLMAHASEPASAPGHRRVLHLDFSMVELPEGLRWAVGG
jgi:hypothetical protein